jgi:uncharacterized protein (TIGR03435 family)
MRILALIVLTLSCSSAQSFEAATVRAAQPVTGGGRTTTSGDRVVYSNTTLFNALARAFGLTIIDQVVGPDWVFSARYDIVAKAPDNTPKDQLPLMMRNLLIERFKLALHHETKNLPAYALMIGGGRLKLQEVKAPAVKDDWVGSGDDREARSVSMASLATILSPMVKAPVLDQTGLAGYYGFPFETTKEETRQDSRPSVFTVVEELGLKLESRKMPFDVIVIDSGSKVPTDN